MQDPFLLFKKNPLTLVVVALRIYVFNKCVFFLTLSILVFWPISKTNVEISYFLFFNMAATKFSRRNFTFMWQYRKSRQWPIFWCVYPVYLSLNGQKSRDTNFLMIPQGSFKCSIFFIFSITLLLFSICNHKYTYIV